MGIVEDFPEDPTRASLSSYAASGNEITIPWSKGKISLGTGVLVNSPGGQVQPLRNAFEGTKDQSPLVFVRETVSNYREASSSHVSEKSEHMHLAFTVTVDALGGLAEASGQFAYDRDVAANTDVSIETLTCMKSSREPLG